MDELCTACHCTGRKLFFITETGFEHLYSQIINEIPIYQLSELCVRICWECKALLWRLQVFKEQVKRCYIELLQYVQQNTSKPLASYPHLQIQQTEVFSYPLCVKEEPEDKSELYTHIPLSDDESPLYDDEQLNGDDYCVVKSEETHCEPETFVRDLNLREIKKKKGTKHCDKTIKEKSKKKQKIKNDKEVKKKSTRIAKNPLRVKRTLESIIDSTISDCYRDINLEDEQKIEEDESKEEESSIEKEEVQEPGEIDDTGENVEIMPVKEKSKKKQKIKSEKEVKKKIKKQTIELRKNPRRVKRTIDSIADSTISNSYRDIDLEDEEKTEEMKSKVEEMSIEKEEIQESKEIEDTGENVDIIIYSTPNYNVKAGNITKDFPVKKASKIKERLPERPTCVECGKSFSSRKTYKYHLNVLHKGQNRYPCPQCGKIYQWKSNLGRHIRSHKARDSGELYCELCDKRFASVATYRQHLRISRRHVSESEFSFSCDDCGKKFVNKTRLRDHIDWEHLKKIKFKCQKCNKPFKCHTSLYVHMQNVHCSKDKKQNLCHVCGKSYQNAAKLKYHIVAMHTSETPYRCQQCGAAFGWYSSLYRHVREVHYKIKLQTKKSKKLKKTEVLPSLLPVMPQQLMLQAVHQPGPV